MFRVKISCKIKSIGVWVDCQMRSVSHVANQRGDPLQKGACRDLAFGGVHADKAAHDPAPVGLRLSPKLTDPQHRSEALVGRARRLARFIDWFCKLTVGPTCATAARDGHPRTIGLQAPLKIEQRDEVIDPHLFFPGKVDARIQIGADEVDHGANG